MIGYYNYTVILTYASLLSAGLGIVISLSGNGHPYIGTIFLLICGLLDAFDGQVARTKKDRTQSERSFGIQIDSLTDLVAFGVLPACIGMSLINTTPLLKSFFDMRTEKPMYMLLCGLLLAVLVLYILAALIRLAYFNVLEEDRHRAEGGGKNKVYIGLPVTISSLIFPNVMLFRYIFPSASDWISVIYFVVAIIVGFLFLAKVKFPKAGVRGIIIMVTIGCLETTLLIVALCLKGVG